MPRGFPFGRRVADGGEFSGRPLDRERRDLVRPAGGAVEELAAGVDLDLRRRVRVGGGWRVSVRDRLELLRLPVAEVFESGDAATHLVVHVEEFVVRMEIECRGPPPGGVAMCGGSAGVQRAGGGVELVELHLVETEVRDQCQLAARVEIDRVRMRLVLTLRVRAGAFVLDDRGGRRERAVVLDRHDADRSRRCNWQ